MSEIAADADAETARIAVLMAFGTQPKRDADTDWLLAHCDAATYALATDHLPTGGWISQGYPYECCGHGDRAGSFARGRVGGEQFVAAEQGRPVTHAATTAPVGGAALSRRAGVGRS